MKDESGLKSALMRQIKLSMPRFVALRHEDVRTAGIPDLSLSGNHLTTWWEAKHATPKFDTFGLQELTMLRLDANGYAARYIIWQEQKDGSSQRTLIIRPKDIGELIPEAACDGYDMAFVASYMKELHEAVDRR